MHNEEEETQVPFSSTNAMRGEKHYNNNIDNLFLFIFCH
jgi:hypothetical protein